MSKIVPKVHLTAVEKSEIDEAFSKIQGVLARKNVNIERVLGLVTSEEVVSAAKQVEIKFAVEESTQFNMIAFN